MPSIYPDNLSNTPRLPAFRVTFTCSGGHSQAFVWYGVEETWVRGWAALVDGSSPLYIYPPRNDPNSVLGKCGICRCRLRAEIEDVEHEVMIEARAAGCAAALWNTNQVAPRTCELCVLGPCRYGIARNPLPEDK